MRKTFKELVDEALEKRGKSKSELGRAVLGRGYAYQGYYDLTSQKKSRLKLTPERLQKLCEFLEVPLNHFADPDMTVRRSDYIREEFVKFMSTEIAGNADPEILTILEHIPFLGNRLPTKALYEALAIAMRDGRYSNEQLIEAARENDELAQVDLAKEKMVTKVKKLRKPPPANDSES